MAHKCICGAEFPTPIMLAQHIHSLKRREPGKHEGARLRETQELLKQGKRWEELKDLGYCDSLIARAKQGLKVKPGKPQEPQRFFCRYCPDQKSFPTQFSRGIHYGNKHHKQIIQDIIKLRDQGLSRTETMRRLGVGRTIVYQYWSAQISEAVGKFKTVLKLQLPVSKPQTFEEILASAPDITSIATLFFEGFWAKLMICRTRIAEMAVETVKLVSEIDRLKAADKTELHNLRRKLHFLTLDLNQQTRKKLEIERKYATLYNEVTASKRLQHLTIDQVRHETIKKDGTSGSLPLPLRSIVPEG